MKSTDIVLQIQASYNQFTKAEKKVASYVIENKKKVLYMSITDLADACQVGETSVYRFCRTINLQGYQEFKMKLSISLAAEGSIHKRKEEDGDLIDILTRQIKSSVYFYQSIQYMIAQGVEAFVEIGPGKALSAFVKMTDRSR